MEAEELDEVAWIPVDQPIVGLLRDQLRGITLAEPNGVAAKRDRSS